MSLSYEDVCNTMSLYIPTQLDPNKIKIYSAGWWRTMSWSMTMGFYSITNIESIQPEYIIALLQIWDISFLDSDFMEKFKYILDCSVPSARWQWYKNDEQFFLYRMLPALNDAVLSYKNYEYYDLNSSLRLEPLPCIGGDRDLWNGAFLQAIAATTQVLNRNIRVYRYIPYNIVKSKFSQTGILKQAAYTSTSASFKFVLNIILDSGVNDYAMIEIRIPVGSHCVILPTSEYEIIIPYNSEMKLIKEAELPAVGNTPYIPYLIFDLVFDGIC